MNQFILGVVYLLLDTYSTSSTNIVMPRPSYEEHRARKRRGSFIESVQLEYPSLVAPRALWSNVADATLEARRMLSR